MTLAEIADLDTPARLQGQLHDLPAASARTPLTDFMMVPYVDSELGLHDPDELGNWTPEDFAQYARDSSARASDETAVAGRSARRCRSELETSIARSSATRGRATTRSSCPTDSLYIEALPGDAPAARGLQARATARST